MESKMEWHENSSGNWKLMLREGANFFCKVIDKINGDPKAAKTTSFYCTIKTEEGYIQVGLKAPAEGYEKYVHKAYLHKCTVRQFNFGQEGATK